MTRQKIIGIMACDPQGVIGLNGKMPWNIPEEWAHFCNMTENNIIVMGHKTYSTTPQDILEKRYSIVMTHHQDFPVNHPNLRIIQSMNDLLKIYTSLPKDKTIFMIGGAELAEQFFKENFLDEFLLTKIHRSYEGDTMIPLHYLDQWPSTCIRKERDFSIYHYVNPHPSWILKPITQNASLTEGLFEKLKILGEGWQINTEGHLTKHYVFKDFMEAMGFANKIAQIAEQENHHPRVTVSLGECNIETWSHDVNGLSERDFILADKIEKMGGNNDEKY